MQILFVVDEEPEVAFMAGGDPPVQGQVCTDFPKILIGGSQLFIAEIGALDPVGIHRAGPRLITSALMGSLAQSGRA
ncbi:hypothetical protein [Guyparkeria halopsychrophila]|uniref:hypothetical protein n=1 Tax=Guyparkeria halopsychrophila TaxID=3139421 RepID=UPI0037C57F67